MQCDYLSWVHKKRGTEKYSANVSSMQNWKMADQNSGDGRGSRELYNKQTITARNRTCISTYSKTDALTKNSHMLLRLAV